MFITTENIEKENIPLNEGKKIIVNKCVINKAKQEKIAIICKDTIQKNKVKNETILFVKYAKKENERILSEYGQEIFEYAKSKENPIITQSDTRPKAFQHIRTALIDWMIEVFFKYSLSYETFFLTFHIMDLLINNEDHDKLSKKTMHLIGITSMFIATKIEEVCPISLMDFIYDIGHNNFTKNEILSKEKSFISSPAFNDIISYSLYDYINIFFYDFIVYNPTMKIEDICTDIKSKTIYYALIMIHYDPSFSSYQLNHRAIACIILASQDTFLQPTSISNKSLVMQKYFIEDWHEFILRENNTNEESIEPLIILLRQTITKYFKDALRHNLTTFYPSKKTRK